MATKISPNLEAKIAELVASGHYMDANDLIDQAVQLLESRDRRLEWLRAAIVETDEQFERGEGIPYTSALMDAIDREVEERFHRGEQPSPDVAFRH